MVATAALTSGGRIKGVPHARARAIAAIGVPAVGAAGILIAVGAFEPTPRAAIPTAGILIGGAMAATTLTGRRLLEGLDSDAELIEARLSLGDRIRNALAPTVRQAIKTGLIPAIDQTRNVGIVTLPGTFVGLVLGGASPAEAARIQLTVLLTLLAVELLARDRDRRADRAHPDRPGRAPARRCRRMAIDAWAGTRPEFDRDFEHDAGNASAYLLHGARPARPAPGQARAQRARAARRAAHPGGPRRGPRRLPHPPHARALRRADATTGRARCAPTTSSTPPPSASPA